MSFLQINYHSRVLRMDTQVNVVLPEKRQGVGLVPELREGNYPVLLLLHGTSGDNTDWERWTSIERYAAKKGIAVVMPGAQLSGYANMVYGERFFDYIATELLEDMRKYFPISDRREDTFVAGLSMGGYGALKVGLTYPERFAAIGTLSNGNHAYMSTELVKALKKLPPLILDRFHLCWALEECGTVVGSKHDIFALANRNIEEGRPLPPIFAACGIEDHNYPMAAQMRDFFLGLEGNPYHYDFHEEPGGHTWEFWDKWIQDYLDWLPIQK